MKTQNKVIPLFPNALVTKNLTTTSLMLAEQFKRRHDSILRTIENIIFDMDEDELNRRRIVAVDYIDAKGESRKSYELGEEMSLVITGRLTGKKALVAQLKLADAFIAMRNFIATEKLKLSHNLHPQSISAIAGTRDNRTVKEVYDELIEAGYAFNDQEVIVKNNYRVTLAGDEAGFYNCEKSTIRVSPRARDLLIKLLETRKAELRKELES